MCYVGDNIKKDFVAPEELGMRCIWFRNRDGLYYIEEDNNYAWTIEEKNTYRAYMADRQPEFADQLGEKGKLFEKTSHF